VIPGAIGQLQALQMISLGHNPALRAVPQAVLRLQLLKVLHLDPSQKDLVGAVEGRLHLHFGPC
jgi:hypothetical protein